MSHRLQVLIPESMAVRLRAAARRARTSNADWVRRVLRSALDETDASDDPVAAMAALNAPTGDVEQLSAEIERGRMGDGSGGDG